MGPSPKSRPSGRGHWPDSLPTGSIHLWLLCSLGFVLPTETRLTFPNYPFISSCQKSCRFFTAVGPSYWHLSLHLSALVGLEVEGGQVSPLPTNISYSPPILTHSKSDSSFRSHLGSALTSLTSLIIHTTRCLLASKPSWPIVLGTYDSHLYRRLLFKGFLLSLQV